ncbi:MAG TPA: DsbE family thiol:disulfide interchange protein [Steroidobacteraceae bacterium]|jgi:cytochrome c biogenesis protein CcmG/thiol:disulfide interchange protein DsbE|nr:DsbE family thiol:disulfide interchange protein [Steroidobacteraceae bacterium]
MNAVANRFALPLAGFALLLVVLIAGLYHAPEKGIIVSPLLGKPTPQFSLPGLLDESSPLQAQTLRGHWSLVNVWGTWCFECRAEHETLLQIKQQGKVPIFGIDWKDDDDKARAWLSELGNPYERIGADREGRVAIDWGVYGAPESFLINPSGTVVYKHVGALTPEIWQQEFLSRLL